MDTRARSEFKHSSEMTKTVLSRSRHSTWVASEDISAVKMSMTNVESDFCRHASHSERSGDGSKGAPGAAPPSLPRSRSTRRCLSDATGSLRNVTVTHVQKTRHGFYSVPYQNTIGYVSSSFIDAQLVMIAYNENFQVVRWNSAAEALTGLLEVTCVGKPLSELIEMSGGTDVREALRSARRNTVIKVKIHALATAPVTVLTIVAPILDDTNNVLGSMLVCAIPTDNLREHRFYMQDYLRSEMLQCLSLLLSHKQYMGSVERNMITTLYSCAHEYTANRIDELAREMLSDWEWTSADQLLCFAFNREESVQHKPLVDPMFPPSICVNPLVSSLIHRVVSAARGACRVALSVLNQHGNIFSLSIVISLLQTDVAHPDHPAEDDKSFLPSNKPNSSDNTSGHCDRVLDDDDDDDSLNKNINTQGSTNKMNVNDSNDTSRSDSNSANAGQGKALTNTYIKRSQMYRAYDSVAKANSKVETFSPVLNAHLPTPLSVQPNRSDNVSITGKSTAITPSGWSKHQLNKAVRSYLRKVGGFMYIYSDSVTIRLPCQVSTGIDDVELADFGPPLLNYTVHVVTALSNMADQHNLSLILLRTRFVSLASVQERSDLEQRLLARPCEVDVVICDYKWLSEAREVLLSNHGALVIPLVGAVPLGNLCDFPHAIKLPIVAREVHALMVEVGQQVGMRKHAAAARKEREEIFTLRQDSPWTRGRLLGRGSHGIVYEATTVLTGGKMAVKMFYFSADHEEGIKQLLNEIKIMCSVDHENIVHYFHCERSENNVNLFMELCDCSLADVIHSQRRRSMYLTVTQVLHHVLTAVAYLHSHGIVHRDIKPQNILLKNNVVKLTDFGTARKGNKVREVQGTFRYMAPEVYRGEPHSFSCDIWSIGCLICELYNCPPPFMSQASLLGEMTSAVPHLSEVPKNLVLRDILYKCFRLDPSHRPTANELLTHELLDPDSPVNSNGADRLVSILEKPPEGTSKFSRQSAFSISSE